MFTCENMAVVWHFIFLALLLQLVQGTKQSKLTYFGTKTPYNYQHSNSSFGYPDACTPIHIEFVSRHGSRYPSKSDRKNIDDLLKKLDGFYNLSSPFHLKNLTLPWKKWNEWKDADSRELSARGMREQYEIAKRLRSNFPEVFEKEYWNKYYKFIARDTPRTSQSAMAFALGLFENFTGSLNTLKFQPVAIKSAGPKEHDKLLSSYDACPRYAIDVDEDGLDEYKKFIEGSEIKGVVQSIEKRLRINGSLLLAFEDAETITKLCAFGLMNHDDDSWCALLNEEDLNAMNYASDVENFYEHSWGNELSYKIICFLLGDITKNLEDFSNGTNDVRGEFRFASSGTLLSLFTILEAIDNGTVLRANNFKQNSNQEFLKLVPMSANIAFVLYKCNLTDQSGKKSVYEVQILENEKPVRLPCCHGRITCSLDEFLTYFKETVDSCEFDEMCALPKVKSTTPKSGSSKPNSNLLLIMMITFIAAFKLLRY